MTDLFGLKGEVLTLLYEHALTCAKTVLVCP